MPRFVRSSPSLGKFMVSRVLSLLLVVSAMCLGADQYAGAEVCASCHKSIADTQSKTAMANTWHGRADASLPAKFDENIAEGMTDSLHYEIRRTGERFEFSVAGTNAPKLTAPVDSIVGGKRHGLSFLLNVDQVGGITLERPAMLEGRYALSHLGSLVLSPGFSTDKPSNDEDELGRVLSPTFEQRCLSCHGKPETLGAGKQGGVRCESCHGPASEHVNSIASGKPMVRPKSLTGAGSIEVCAQCHNGLSTSGHSDPMPEDLLVSSQVPALRHSECFIQSREKVTCTTCHNPHEDSAAVTQTTVNACLGCHSLGTPQHAAVCPVNRTQGCVGCHMPTVQSDSFRLTDHWIRVHPEPGTKLQKRDDSLRSQVIPRREYLRLILVDSDEKLQAVTQRLSKGESFSVVAHDLSVDPTAPGGGYLGDVELSDMDPKLAAAAGKLSFGENSEVVSVGANRIILHRQPRDFRWEADRLFLEASDLNKRGDRAAAIAKNREALDVYPYLLRGLTLMGTMLGQAGNASRASEVLAFAAQNYPKDAASEFNLALTLVKQPAAQIEALRHTLEIDPDMVVAYQSLGAALYSTGQAPAAIETFRKGLQIDPLSAILYYDLGLALKEQGDGAGAKRALELAGKLDAEIAARK